MELEKLESKSDRRGTLVEAFKLPHDGQLFYVIAKPNEMRGNHYHEHKTETFLVIYGSAEITVKDRSTDNIMRVTVSGGDPMSVKIVPNHTHTITASPEGCIFLVWANELFDETNPDTITEEV